MWILYSDSHSSCICRRYKQDSLELDAATLRTLEDADLDSAKGLAECQKALENVKHAMQQKFTDGMDRLKAVQEKTASIAKLANGFSQRFCDHLIRITKDEVSLFFSLTLDCMYDRVPDRFFSLFFFDPTDVTRSAK